MEREQDKPAQNDQAWFDALSGKEGTGQGALLHKVLREVELSEAAQEETEHDWQRLQFALKREASQQRFRLRHVALAASVLILVGAVAMLMPPRQNESHLDADDSAVMRGQAQRMIMSQNPERKAKQLEAELRNLGVQVVRRTTAEKTELDVTLSYPVSDDVRAVLESHIIPVPELGDLKVTFIKAPQ